MDVPFSKVVGNTERVSLCELLVSGVAFLTTWTYRNSPRGALCTSVSDRHLSPVRCTDPAS